MKSEMTKEAYFNRFTIELPAQAVSDCSHHGECDDDVAHWAGRVKRPEDVTAERLRAELKEYGAWDAEELADDEANWKRIIWIAAGNIKDEEAETKRNETTT